MQEHFKSEEDLMSKYGHPQLELHKNQHSEFRKKVAMLCFDTADGLKEVPQILLDYLKDWLTQHILQEDMAFKPFFDKLGIR